MKTVHGAEFYANKKHKGIDSNSDDGPPGLDSSPRSEDMQSHKTASLSSPSIKSEVSFNHLSKISVKIFLTKSFNFSRT